MAIGGTINGREINWFAINAGVNVWDLDIDMSFAFTSSVAAMVRTRVLDPYAITTFNQALSPLTRAKLLASDENVHIDQSVDQMIRTLLLASGGDIVLDQYAGLDIFPAMIADHVITFAPECEIDHVFFGKWIDGIRMILHAEDRGIRVPEDNRRIIVPPEPDELVEKKGREVFA